MADETEVVLTANTQPYERSVDQATVATNRMINAVNQLGLAVDNAFKSAGKTMVFGGAGLTAGIVASGLAAAKLDQQMSHLSATMTMANKGSSEYQTRMGELSKSVSNLRSEFGLSTREAVDLNTQLVRLGQNTRNVKEITESYMQLSAVSGEGVNGLVDGMVSLQRMMNTEGVRSTKLFNATLAELSTNAGASATSILQFSSAIAPVAKVSGMTQREIMGVSTAFVKAGADGYMAANAFNKMLTDITRSIQYGSPELAAYSNLIGVSIDQFKSMPRVEAVTRLFEEINKQGPDAIKTLDRFGLDGIRHLKSIQAVANQGGIRKAVTDALGGGDAELLGKSSEQVFKGFNDEMKKLSENLKQVVESFGQGVIPIFEKTARAANAILSPIKSLLDLLNKLPGGAAGMAGIAALGLGITGVATQSFKALTGAGIAYGAYSTARSGIRGGALRAGYDVNMTPREQRDFINNQLNRAGFNAPGSGMHHALYNAYGRLGAPLYGFRERWAAAADERQGLPMGQRLNRMGAGVTRFVGSMFRAGLVPLSDEAVYGSNFDRDQSTLAFRDPDLKRSLGIRQVGEAWGRFKGAFSRDDDAAAATKNFTGAMNTANDSTKKFNSTFRQLTHETGQFGKALMTAGKNITVIGGRGMTTMAMAGMERVGPRIWEGTKSLGSQAYNFMGGPIGMGLMAGTALYGMYQQRNNLDQQLAQSLQETNVSPFNTYASAVGEATKATLSFAEALKQSTPTVEGEAPANRPSTALREATMKSLGEYTYEPLSTATESQARSYASMVFASGASPTQQRALQSDLMRRFGTDEQGLKIVESIMAGTRDSSRINLGPAFGQMYDDRSWYQGIFGATDRQRMMSTSMGEQLNLSMNRGGGQSNNERARMLLVGLNQAYSAVGSRGMGGVYNEGGVEAIAGALAKGVLGPNADEEVLNRNTQEIASILMKTASYGGKTTEDFQQALAESDSDIGRQVAEAIKLAGKDAFGNNVGWDRSSLEMPSMRSYANTWEGVGVNSYTLGRLGGTSRDDSGALIPGAGGDLAQFIFGNRVGNSAVSRAVGFALDNQTNVNAQYEAMNQMSMAAEGFTGSLTGGVTELEKMKNAVKDVNDPLYQMANAAQQFLMQQRSIELSGMARTERFSANRADYNALLASHNANPTDESGQMVTNKALELQNQEAEVKNYMRSVVLQGREFNIQRGRAEEDFARTLAYNLEDYNRSRMYAEEDFARQRKYSQEDFQKSRMRAEQDFQHQVVVMTRNAAKQIMNIYERLTVQRTWSASNLLSNMRDQQEKLTQQQQNLAKLRERGLSGDAINVLGLNDPANAQQLARLTDDMLNDPKMIEAYNKAIKKRMSSAKDVVTDRDSDQWKEMRYSFNLNMERQREDFNKAMSRSEEQFQISTDRQREQFGIALERMHEQYQRSMDRAAADFQRSFVEITGNFEELQEKSLDILTGTGEKQLRIMLNSVKGIRSAIKRESEGVYDDVDRIFKKLGINDYGMTTVSGKTMTQGHIKIGDKWVNVGTFAQGGPVTGKSAYNQQDNIPIMATAGEYMQPVDAVNYYGQETMEALRNRKIPKGLLQGFADGGPIYKAMEGWVARNIPDIGVTSGYRPGAVTATGFTSMHASGRAVDLAPPSMGAFNKIKGTFGPSIYELIYSPAGYQQMFKGKNHYYGEPTRGDHWDHIHWAMQTFGKALAGAFPELNIWDGTLDSIVKLIKEAKHLNKMDSTLSYSPHPTIRKWGGGFMQRSVTRNALSLLGGGEAVDSNYKAIKKIDWKGDGALFNGPQVVGVGERGPEAVFPLDQRGADFMYELMKRNATDSKKAMLTANGVPQRASTVSYYQRVDKSTIISGDITVVAQDPDEMLRKIEAKKKMEALKGRS